MDIPVELTPESPTYTRPGGSSSNYHYLTRQLTVSSSGDYSFRSSSSVPLLGYVYVDRFDPSNPTANLIGQGQSDANGQLHFTVSLQVVNQLLKRVGSCIILHVKDDKQLNTNRFHSLRSEQSV